MRKTVLLVLGLFIFIGTSFAQEDDVKGFVDDKKEFKKDTFGWKKGGYLV